MNNKILSIGLIILGLLIVAIALHDGDIAWMILPFMAYLGAGIFRSPAIEKVHINAKRTTEKKQSNDGTLVEMSLDIQNQSAETICISISETIQEGMKILEGNLGRLGALRAGESAELRYCFTATRGIFSWDSIRTEVSDPLGLVKTEMLLPARARVQIQPKIKKFKAIPFRPQATLHSPGSIPARLGGSGTDFFGIREYHPGDSLRRLDWRLTARHPRKFFTKEFEQEEIAEIGLIVDARQKTNYEIGEKSLVKFSLEAAASLAEMFLHQGHRVSLLVFGERIIHAFPGYGKQQLHRILERLSKVKISKENHSSVDLDYVPLGIFPSKALLVVISPLTSNDRPFFQRLRASGYQALLISPDPVSFAFPTSAKDLDQDNCLAIRATRIERNIRLNNISQLHIPTIDWQVDKPLFPLVRNALTRSRGQREK